jgi:hypothetical protein
MADVQIAVIDTNENEVNVAVPGVQGPIGLTGSVAIAQAGTATEPGIRFESDTNTGIYNPGADQLAISTNAVERVEFGTSEVVFNDGGTNYDFRIEGDTDANLLFVDASTDRVGIGTASPATTLDVNGDVTISDKIIHDGDTNTAIRFPAADTVSVETGGSEAARIDSSGRLLIGTSTSATYGAAGLLQILGTTNAHASIARITDNNADPTFNLAKACGVVGAPTIVNSGDNLGRINFAGYDGGDFESIGAWIQGQVDGTPGANDMPGRLVFSTTADGAASPTERLRITSAGVLQVADAGDITVGTTTGTKIGTATTQKIGFYNATPVVQPAAVADATDAVDVITQLNDLLAKLRTLGIIAT